MAVQFSGQGLDPLAQLLGELGQRRVLMHQLDQLGGLFRGRQFPFLAGEGDGFAMLRIGVSMRFVAVGLAGLREEDERRGIGRLQTEREVEEDKGIDIEMDDADDVKNNPNRHDEGLPNKEDGRAKEAGESLRFECKPIVPENGGEMVMRKMKTKMMAAFLHDGRRVAWIHPATLAKTSRPVERAWNEWRADYSGKKLRRGFCPRRLQQRAGYFLFGAALAAAAGRSFFCAAVLAFACCCAFCF